MPRSTVKGHRETRRALRQLSKQLDRPAGEASRFALQPMKKAAQQNLATPKPGHPQGNVITGELKDSLSVRKVKRTPPGQVAYHVTATGSGIRKAHLVEFGTDPHWQPKRGVMHPGARPFPFLTPAFEEHEDDAKKRYGEKIGDAIERQAARLNKRR